MKRQGFDDALIGAILGVSDDDVRSLLVDASPSVYGTPYYVLELRDIDVPAGTDWGDVAGYNVLDEFTLPVPRALICNIHVALSVATDVTILAQVYCPEPSYQGTLIGGSAVAGNLWGEGNGTVSLADSLLGPGVRAPAALPLQVHLKTDGAGGDIVGDATTIDLLRVAMLTL